MDWGALFAIPWNCTGLGDKFDSMKLNWLIPWNHLRAMESNIAHGSVLIPWECFDSMEFDVVRGNTSIPWNWKFRGSGVDLTGIDNISNAFTDLSFFFF